MDKTARLFNKISKHKHPTCTKFYAFTEFDLRLKLTRSYTVSSEFLKLLCRKFHIFPVSQTSVDASIVQLDIFFL